MGAELLFYTANDSVGNEENIIFRFFQSTFLGFIDMANFSLVLSFQKHLDAVNLIFLP